MTSVKNLRATAIALASLALCLLVLFGCSNSEDTDKKLEFEGETVPVTLKISCDSNLLFSRYDLAVTVDDVEIGEVSHGSMEVFNIDLPLGAHQLTLSNVEDKGIKGIVDFVVDDNHSFEFTAACTNDRVNIEQIVPSLESDDSVNDTPSDETADESNSDTAVADPEAALRATKGKPVTDFFSLCQSLGYTYRLFTTDSDAEITDYFTTDPKAQADWSVLEIDTIDTSNKQAVIYIQRTETANAKDQLEDKLSASRAWIAVDDYGKVEFPHGFKLHYIMDKLAEEARTDGTWFLKAGCDVKNTYGTWEKGLVCEAVVSGTDDNSVVESFIVY